MTGSQCRPGCSSQSYPGIPRQTDPDGPGSQVTAPSPPIISAIPSGSDGAKAFGSRLEKIDKQVGGSTGNQVFRDDEGQKWIAKFYRSKKTDQVRNEFVTNQLCREAVITAPEARLALAEEDLYNGWIQGMRRMEAFPSSLSQWESLG
jgi:hypothetical protein